MTGTLGRVADRIGAVVLLSPRIVRLVLGAFCLACAGNATELAVFGHHRSQWTGLVVMAVIVIPLLWADNRSWVPRGAHAVGPRIVALQVALIAIPVVAAVRVGPIAWLDLVGSVAIAVALWRYAALPLARGHRTPRKVRASA